ncbi:MAG TPA: dihydroorotate dehydrogenase electron transfer subunit [Candidatus Nitrosopolaris sp.]|nr:dihydroorotate dehydrogenase electron transfer subunit [Candidatus Nitrosopolaris sp.]
MPININIIRNVLIERVINETASVKTILFKDRVSSKAEPGQFLMVWIPGVEELPLSVMIADEEDKAAITIRRQGVGSTALFNKRAGDMLGVRGPYGNRFEIAPDVRTVLLVGGGTGLVPLIRLASKLNELRICCTLIIGASSRKEVFFEKTAAAVLSNTKHNIIVSTESGDYGIKGKTTDAMTQVLKKESFDSVYTCGPELMMKKVLDIASAYSLPIQASLERYMKCGIGICASCCIDDKLVCKDGTVFCEKQLFRMNEFGMSKRDKSGRQTFC